MTTAPKAADADPLLHELEQRWQRMFSALAAGSDVPPAQRLRTEGLMEAAVLCGAREREALDAAMDACYRQARGRGLEADFGPDWRAFYPFPVIPAVGLRAPVHPSTPV
jgi:hypothetical protein